MRRVCDRRCDVQPSVYSEPDFGFDQSLLAGGRRISTPEEQGMESQQKMTRRLFEERLWETAMPPSVAASWKSED